MFGRLLSLQVAAEVQPIYPGQLFVDDKNIGHLKFARQYAFAIGENGYLVIRLFEYELSQVLYARIILDNYDLLHIIMNWPGNSS